MSVAVAEGPVMYSAMFAMMVITVIALTNLFLGFAAAVLMGRGPKRWSDLDRAIVLQPFSLDLILPRRKPRVERIELSAGQAPVTLSVEPQLPPSPSVGIAEAEPAPEIPAASQGTRSTPNTEPAPPSGQDATVKKFVLPTATMASMDEDVPPETTLTRQLDAWRNGDLHDETPSMSGLGWTSKTPNSTPKCSLD